MSIKDKLQAEIGYDSISLRPNRQIAGSLKWFFGLAFFTVVALLAFRERLGQGGEVLCFGFIIYFAGHGLVDYFFRLNVRYIFDRGHNAVYRENLGLCKQIMKLDEAVIFTSSESGNWHYSLGIRKKQFLKSYKISPNFGGGKAAEIMALEYEEEILTPISALLGIE